MPTEGQECLGNLGAKCAPRAQTFDSEHHGIKSDLWTTNLPVLLVPSGSKSPRLGVLLTIFWLSAVEIQIQFTSCKTY